LTEFFHVITPDRFAELLRRFPRLSGERVRLDASLSRTLSTDVVAGEDLPELARSTVDGYAVRAEDTFGASESIPALLDVIEAVRMGTVPDFALGTGQAAPIPTGGFLPRGADAVVMVEYTNPAGKKNVEVTRPLTVKANVLEKGEDTRAGDVLLKTGMQLRPQDVGFLAALGVTEIEVFRKPKVAILSSGDEIVPVDRIPGAGQIRDANGHSLAALVREAGADPIPFGIVPDNAEALRGSLEAALSGADMVAISGGSSVGARDLMKDVVSGLSGTEILAHGIAIRPGKPTLLADATGKPVFGLPGHPVSALVVAQVFLAPFLRYLQGAPLQKGPPGHRIAATLLASIHSTIGLEEYVRLRIEETPERTYEARPVYGKSGMLSTMVRANGILVIPMTIEGFSRGETVPAILL
jgi:molybdopterin molybdotransferase